MRKNRLKSLLTAAALSMATITGSVSGSIPVLTNLVTAEAATAFSDVRSDAYYYDAVNWAVNAGVTNGTSPTTFSPNNGCTRGQIVTFLYNAYGNGEQAAESSFSDVAPDAYYHDAVNWAVAHNVTSGTGDGKFSPNQVCTRGQAITFISNIADTSEIKYHPQDARYCYDDVPDDAYYFSPIGWGLENGIATGVGGKTYAPNAACTRAQIVTMIYHAIKNFEPASKVFSPVPLNELVNYEAIKGNMSDAEFQQAYDEAVKVVTPLAGECIADQMHDLSRSLRGIFESGMTYSMGSLHDGDPYGYLVLGQASCAGCARTTGLCLNILGMPFEHVNAGKNTHQWARTKINGVYWICDAYMMTSCAEPAPYAHPALLADEWARKYWNL